MNTLMKIMPEIWIFLGIAASSSLFFLFEKSSGKTLSIIKSIWALAVVILILASLISPLAMSLTLASGKETLYGKPPKFDTLNGLEYLFYENPEDFLAINWIEQNIVGTHVIGEAPGDAYTYSARISSLTGLSTIIGWPSHELMWRGIGNTNNLRIYDTDFIYNSDDNQKVLELLDTYNVEYIYIGELERKKYSEAGLQKFGLYPEYYTLVYEYEDVSIYEVNKSIFRTGSQT